MAAYAALVSVMHIIETIQNHPRPPISFDKDQLQSLTHNITFLQEFLETHTVDDDDLESRIADAAYAVEDVIESHIVDQIEASKTISFSNFYDGLHKVIQDLDLIRRDMSSFAKKAGIKDDDEVGIKDDDDDQLLRNNYSLRRSRSSTSQDTPVGLDDVVVEVMNKLTWNHSNRHIIPIVGMGGIGKTTLANNIYVNPVIVQYFDFRGWATISQEYNSKEILLEVLLCWNTMGSREGLSEMSEDELGDKLYKSLCGRRYFIVLDDIWSIEAWDKVKTFFPNNNDGSVIILTTRLSNLAFQLRGSYCHEMNFLDEDKSWNLFCKCTFGEQSCPRELKGIGKKIVENCKGLPLSIVLVGGLLAKLKQTRQYWLYIAGNLNSIVNLENNERCLKILDLSYKELPVHLKPCFLYMGVYPEDYVIDIPELMRLWVAEGFVKPIGGKCLEVVAKEYFNDLVGRNLILVYDRGYSGEMIKCKVHDLLVDVCVREAQKNKFLCVARHHNFSNPQNLSTQRRIVVHDGTMPEVIRAWLSHHGTFVRSLTIKYSRGFPKFFYSKLLRVLRAWDPSDDQFDRNINPNPNFLSSILIFNPPQMPVNCRYISGVSIPSPRPSLLSSIFTLIFSLCIPYSDPSFLSSFRLLWNLQTLYVPKSWDQIAASEIWKMSQLRHVHFDQLNLLDPPLSGYTNIDEGDDFVLENLQTLSHVRNFKLSQDVVKRIPNLKELGVCYDGMEEWSSYCINNLVQLTNLESLYFTIWFLEESIPSELLENLSFPRSLKELRLEGTKLDWGDLGTNIGSLPHLQVLKLWSGSIVGVEWETVEGQFCSLKYLEIYHLDDLEYWRTESWTHFPCLEHLSLYLLRNLKEIPSEIGETLKSIKMEFCSESAVFSAKEILKKQEGLGNEGLEVQVTVIRGKNPDVESLAAPNFQVKVSYF